MQAGNGKNMRNAGFIEVIPHISGDFILIADSNGFNDFPLRRRCVIINYLF